MDNLIRSQSGRGRGALDGVAQRRRPCTGKPAITRTSAVRRIATFVFRTPVLRTETQAY